MSRRRRAVPVLLLTFAAGGLAGCSQVQQLQPVAGDEITAVRIATIDVLANEDVKVPVMPTCAISGDGYACTGKAVGGAPIKSSAIQKAEFGATTDPYGAPAPAVVELQVFVDGNRIFSGYVQDVLDHNGQVSR